MILKRILPFVFSLIGIIVFGQKEGQFIEASQDLRCPFTITAYSTKQGLPQSQVVDIKSKKDGTLILATSNGIVEYDGQEFEEFIHNKSYKNHACKELLWDDASGQLFVNEYSDGLYIFHPRFSLLRTCVSATLANGKLYTVDRFGDVYSASTKELHFERIADTRIKHPQAIHVNYPLALIGTADGLFSVNLITKKVSSVLMGDGISRFVTNPYTSTDYAIAGKAIYRLGSGKPEKIFTSSPGESIISDVAFICKDEYYVATSKGMYYVAPDYSEYFDETFLPSDYLVSLYYNEKEDCLFAGTGEKGLLRLQHKNCYSYSMNREFSQASLGSMIITDRNEILVAGSSGALFDVGLSGVTKYWTSPFHFSSLAAVDSLVFAGTWGHGVYILYNKHPIAHIDMPKELPNYHVHASFKDSRNTLWIGTNKGIAMGKDIRHIRPYLTNRVKGEVICFFEQANGTLCIGGSNGVYLLNPQNELIDSITRKDGWFGKEVRAFYEDCRHKLWIGTYNGGLYCYDHGRLTSINRKKNCLLFSDVFTLAKDKFGYLSMTSNHGLWKVAENDLNDFYYGKLDRLVPFSFGQETGILNTEFNGGFQNNYVRTRHDHFFFPTIEGVVINVPEPFHFQKLLPKIRRVWVNDTLFAATDHRLGRSTHTVQFDFSCARFSDKYNTYYQYKLIGEGFPHDWSRLQKHRSVAFKMLPPGNYTLVIRAVDAFNDHHPSEIRYSFEILPYFYETMWFRIGAILMILAIVITLLRLRILYISRKERHISMVNNTILELKLKAIQAKMNPHFIFNALNNIQYLIVLKELELAENALTDFSQLLRKFLQQSDQSFVIVEDEFEMLRLYLTIEKFRFNNQLTCTFHIEEDLKKLYIPSMLLQPLVENAIKHGLLHSEQERILHIRAIHHNDGMRITIEDNGIGREASSEINKNRHEHVSHGFTLVQEKIKIVEEKYGIVVRFQLVDIRKGSQTGTLVIFDLPCLPEDVSEK